MTGERVHSIEMNCFTEKTGNNFSEEDAQYFEEYEKMLWMCEAMIRTFMQLELEACQEEIAWMITCHNCEALNRPLEEYPARPLPIPPNYIDNLHSRLIKVQQGVLSPTLKMIMKTRYNLPPPTTPRTVHPDDVMRGHRDGENSPQERPQASEVKEEVVVNGTPSTNEGGDFISHIEVETDQEPTQLADRHSELAILRLQGTTAKSTDWGGDCPIQADFVENTNNAVTATRVAAHEEAAIGKHRHGTASTDENKQYDPGGTSDDPLISA